MKHLPKLFQASSKQDHPVYVIKGGQLFRTAFHPDGWSEQPDYEIGIDGKFYRTEHHRLGRHKDPDYVFGKNRQIHRTDSHPDGKTSSAEYEIRD